MYETLLLASFTIDTVTVRNSCTYAVLLLLHAFKIVGIVTKTFLTKY